MANVKWKFADPDQPEERPLNWEEQIDQLIEGGVAEVTNEIANGLQLGTLVIPKGSIRAHPADWKGNQKGGLRIKSVNGKMRHIHPTLRQIKALEYMAQGFTKRQALIRAGYAVSTAEKKSGAVFKGRVMRTLADRMQDRLAERGVDDEYLVEKIKEWLEAEKTFLTKGGEKVTIEDYDTQIKAYDRVVELLNLKNAESNKSKAKRQITLTEFIGDPPGEEHD